MLHITMYVMTLIYTLPFRLEENGQANGMTKMCMKLGIMVILSYNTMR